MCTSPDWSLLDHAFGHNAQRVKTIPCKNATQSRAPLKRDTNYELNWHSFHEFMTIHGETDSHASHTEMCSNNLITQNDIHKFYRSLLITKYTLHTPCFKKNCASVIF